MLLRPLICWRSSGGRRKSWKPWRGHDQKAPEAWLAADASRRTSSRGNFAGARPVQDGDRQAARRFASDALRCPEGKAAGYPRHGVAAREAVRKRAPSLAQSAKALRSASGRAGAWRADQEHSDAGGRLKAASCRWESLARN